jgi:hypothetical protein
MAYTVTRNWQQKENIENENTMAGSLPVKVIPPINTINPSLSSIISPIPPPSLTAAISIDMNNGELPPPPISLPIDIDIRVPPMKIKIESEVNAPIDRESRGRLNRNYLSELDRLRYVYVCIYLYI